MQTKTANKDKIRSEFLKKFAEHFIGEPITDLESAALVSLSKYIDDSTNIIIYSADIEENIAKQLGVSPEEVNDMLGRSILANILIRDTFKRNRLMFNPFYFGKDNWTKTWGQGKVRMNVVEEYDPLTDTVIKECKITRIK